MLSRSDGCIAYPGGRLPTPIVHKSRGLYLLVEAAPVRVIFSRGIMMLEGVVAIEGEAIGSNFSGR